MRPLGLFLRSKTIFQVIVPCRTAIGSAPLLVQRSVQLSGDDTNIVPVFNPRADLDPASLRVFRQGSGCLKLTLDLWGRPQRVIIL